MSKRSKLRKRVGRLEQAVAELTEQLEGESEPRKWKDCYDVDLDPAPPISDELTWPAPGGYLWDEDDDWRRSAYL